MQHLYIYYQIPPKEYSCKIQKYIGESGGDRNYLLRRLGLEVKLAPAEESHANNGCRRGKNAVNTGVQFTNGVSLLRHEHDKSD